MKEKPGIALRTCAEVAQEMLSQPGLFLEFDGVPGFTPPPQALQRYTGERSTRDEERMLKAGALRLLGASDRDIEQACGVTRRTIPLLMAELEHSGRITPLKQRLSAITGDNAERANIALRVLLDRAAEGHEDLELAQMIKAVACAGGIATEKYLLLTGQATEIVETRSGAGREEFEAWWNASVRAVDATVKAAQVSQVAAVDSASVGNGVKPQQKEGEGEPGHGPDTSQGPGGGGSAAGAGPDSSDGKTGF